MNFPKLGKSKLRGAALLLQIMRIILAEPRRLEMDGWGYRVSNPKSYHPPCGTVGCVAGWAGFLAEGDIPYDPFKTGKQLLGLTQEQAYSLFYVASWPTDLKDAYVAARHDENVLQIRADLTAERIRRMIAELKAASLKARRERYNARRKAARLNPNAPNLSRSALRLILEQTPAPVKNEEGNVTEFTIDRRAHGVGEHGGALLNSVNNKMCCLGHLCAAEGHSLNVLKNKSWPDEVEGSKAREVLKFNEQTRIGHINDDSAIENAEREQLLTEKFAEKGIKVNFIN